MYKLFSKNEFQSTDDTQGVSFELQYVRMYVHTWCFKHGQNTSAIKAACRILFHDDT